MPTKNPRLTITFEPALVARLRRLSELSGNSQSALVAELLTGSIPVMDRLIKLMEAAGDVRAELSASFVADMEAAQSRVEAQLGLALQDFDDVNASLVDEVEAIKRRGAPAGMRKRAGGGAVSRPTPISTRGVRSTPKPRRTNP
jgi:hypothetical protein